MFFPWLNAQAESGRSSLDTRPGLEGVLLTARLFLAGCLFVVNRSDFYWWFLFKFHGWPVDFYTPLYHTLNFLCACAILLGILPRIASIAVIIAWLVLPNDWHWIFRDKGELGYFSAFYIPLATLLLVAGAGSCSLQAFFIKWSRKSGNPVPSQDVEVVSYLFSLIISLVILAMLALHVFFHYQTISFSTEVDQHIMNTFWHSWVEKITGKPYEAP